MNKLYGATGIHNMYSNNKRVYFSDVTNFAISYWHNKLKVDYDKFYIIICWRNNWLLKLL